MGTTSFLSPSRYYHKASSVYEARYFRIPIGNSFVSPFPMKWNKNVIRFRVRSSCHEINIVWIARWPCCSPLTIRLHILQKEKKNISPSSIESIELKTNQIIWIWPEFIVKQFRSKSTRIGLIVNTSKSLPPVLSV